MYIQDLIKRRRVELIWSYILDIENDQNPFEEKRRAIERWKALAIVDIEASKSLIEKAREIEAIGIKAKDALHVASAIAGKADYFITTDDKLLKKLSTSQEVKAANPVDVAGEIDGYIN